MNGFKDVIVNSPIRWAGSKKKILNEMLNTFPKNKKNYIEMFLGSGVVLLNVLDNNEKVLKYKNFYVNDINSNIINFYILLRDNINDVIIKMKEFENNYNSYSMDEKEEYYYKIRYDFNNMDSGNEKALLFYFLMKTGFNGVYRENKNGKFNVPFGRKEKIVVNEEYLHKVSESIQNVKFYNLEYRDFLKEIKRNKKLDDAFVYCDPPYLPDDDLVSQKQELYTSDSFNHKLFFENLVELKQKPDVMISMADSKIANIIYNNKPFNRIDMREIVRTINPKKLFSSKEVAFINYDLETVEKND